MLPTYLSQKRNHRHDFDRNRNDTNKRFDY